MNLESLFAYDFALESAWAKILEEGGVVVNLDFVNTRKKAPFVDSIIFLAEPTGTRINYQDQKLWHVFRGTLTTRYVVSRGDGAGADALRLMIGRGRYEAQLFDKNFNQGPHLPDHFVTDMVESTPARGHSADQKFDWFELRHTVTLNIRPSAFV